MNSRQCTSWDENPFLSDPDIHHVEHAFENLEFLVVQDIFLTETAQHADVVLPATCYAEKDGTQTSTERRVQMWRKAQEPPGQAKLDWKIIADVAAAMGYADQFPWETSEDVFNEMRSLTPSYAGMTYERLNKPEALPLAMPHRRTPRYTDPSHREVLPP